MSDSPLRIVPPKITKPDPPNLANLANLPNLPNLDADAPTQDAPQPAEMTLGEMEELRHLLLEPEQLQLSNILERLNNPRVRAREMSRPLPEAIRLRNAQDDALSEALSPTIVQALHTSIKKDPRPVAEAISPLMGPAIRRAIAVALSAMVQSFDQVLKHSLSSQGLKWRIEALRTGKSFAEVVLLHTLVYRVEQVFLIHKQTGLLLHHVTADPTITKDADIVSGMLTAIQVAIGNFARDSFEPSEEEHIDTLDMGEREIWFESGQHAVLAVLIKGQAPETLRSDYFAPALEAIHVEHSEDFDLFTGDTAPYENSRSHLEDCLQSRYEGGADPANFKIPAYVWVLLTAIVMALGVWGFFAIRAQWRWNAYLERLKTEAGIVITETGKQGGKRFVAGLRDPLAADPEAILRQETPIDPAAVAARWEPYQALDAQFVLSRARKILDPPAAVELKFDQGTLTASGVAPHNWIVESRQIARALPGVMAFDEHKLIDEDLKEPEGLRQQIEQQVIRFIAGGTQIAPGQNQILQALLSDIQKLFVAAPAAGRSVHIDITGHTDNEGDENANQMLSQQRAAKILSMLLLKKINKDSLTISGVGSTQPIHDETSEADKQFNRSVSFKVSLLDPRRTKTEPSSANQKEERR